MALVSNVLSKAWLLLLLLSLAGVAHAATLSVTLTDDHGNVFSNSGFFVAHGHGVTSVDIVAGTAQLVGTGTLGNYKIVNAQGTSSLSLDPGDYSVIATYGGGGYASAHADVTVAGVDLEQVLVLEPTMQGTVVFFTDSIADVSIAVTPQEGGASQIVATDNAGLAPPLTLSAGDYAFTATKIGYADVTGTFSVGAGKTQLLATTLSEDSGGAVGGDTGDGTDSSAGGGTSSTGGSGSTSSTSGGSSQASEPEAPPCPPRGSAYYTCTDGTQIERCTRVPLNGQSTCRCAANPESLCPDGGTGSCDSIFTCADGSKAMHCQSPSQTGSASAYAGCVCAIDPEAFCEEYVLEMKITSPQEGSQVSGVVPVRVEVKSAESGLAVGVGLVVPKDDGEETLSERSAEVDASRAQETPCQITSRRGLYYTSCVFSVDTTGAVGADSALLVATAKTLKREDLHKIKVYPVRVASGEDTSSASGADASTGAEDSQVRICTGCLAQDGTCLATGQTHEQEGEHYYCTASGELVLRREDGAACTNAFECHSNICENGACGRYCTGCALDSGACVPIGTRLSDNRYCGVGQVTGTQKGAGAACTNSFECTSNLCVDNQCVQQGFLDQIISFFQSFFGFR